MTILPDFATLITDSAREKCDELTQTFRRLAVGADWPEDIVSALKVSYMDGVFFIDIPSHLERTVDDLEYGTPDSDPTYVKRKFITEFLDELQEDIGINVCNFIFEEGILL